MVLVSLILLFPESPRWLIDHGRREEGLQTLAKLHAHGDVEDPWVKAEFAQIEEAITFDHEHEAKSYLELFRSRYVSATTRTRQVKTRAKLTSPFIWVARPSGAF